MDPTYLESVVQASCGSVMHEKCSFEVCKTEVFTVVIYTDHAFHVSSGNGM